MVLLAYLDLPVFQELRVSAGRDSKENVESRGKKDPKVTRTYSRWWGEALRGRPTHPIILSFFSCSEAYDHDYQAHTNTDTQCLSRSLSIFLSPSSLHSFKMAVIG